jgi:putative transposase
MREFGILKYTNMNTKHHLHSLFEKSIIERIIQYIKNQTKGFNNYFLSKKKKCN